MIMQTQLAKALQHNQLLTMMYMAKDGSITKRRIKVLALTGTTFQAYCFTRKAKRTFVIERVLAVTPVIYHERYVI